MKVPAEGLVGDIGGTNARFALADLSGARPAIHEPRTYANKDYPSAEAAIEAYLKDTAPGRRPESVVLAVAGPVTDGRMDFTNSDWELSEEKLRRHGFRAARLINDFAAQALGAPRVAPRQLLRVGPDVPGQKGGALAVMGPGTGFGVSGLVRDHGRESALATEGGHVGFAPRDETEVQVWRILARRHGHVSIERVLSGRGLVELYEALAEIGGSKPTFADSRSVQAAGAAGDAVAAGAVSRFCSILGAVAGDIALVLGARGGVYVTGGVAVGLAQRIAGEGEFRQAFEDKGRFNAYMAAIPTAIILEPYTALIGSASLLPELESA